MIKEGFRVEGNSGTVDILFLINKDPGEARMEVVFKDNDDEIIDFIHQDHVMNYLSELIETAEYARRTHLNLQHPKPLRKKKGA